ncbi:hypothetical protein [Bifidobacterium biavatii]|uniref:Uncharacterized protein n=1 Tax=Bifidobacterium biavatii DSM 23969 TaxID=1437608 RepID=A0A087A2W6_9BIFI|nr:hypothetical protein [Bifidobacterium biavatii]KFI53116.1 hypothetical protein BBIA_1093 [Bifidobacterium biavatii DSM 23969]
MTLIHIDGTSYKEGHSHKNLAIHYLLTQTHHHKQQQADNKLAIKTLTLKSSTNTLLSSQTTTTRSVRNPKEENHSLTGSKR